MNLPSPALWRGRYCRAALECEERAGADDGGKEGASRRDRAGLSMEALSMEGVALCTAEAPNDQECSGSASHQMRM